MSGSDSKQANVKLLADSLKSHMASNKFTVADLLFHIGRKEECSVE